MYKEHSDLEKPENENAIIWRYMDFTKFVSLLDKSALFFARADKLSDPFEGSFPKANIKLRPEVYKDKIPADAMPFLGTFHRAMVKFTAINCWHLNKDESTAMWKLYIKSNEGIAIQSTFNLLKGSLTDKNHDILIGKVKYIDFGNDLITEGNLDPFVHKRKSFEHEQELRAIIQKLHYDKNGVVDFSKPPFHDGIYVQVDLSVLIDKIYLAPTSPKWLFDLVVSITSKYGLNKAVHQSSLDDLPVY